MADSLEVSGGEESRSDFALRRQITAAERRKYSKFDGYAMIGWLIWSRQTADQQVGEEGVGQTELWASGSSTWLNTELHQRARWPVWVGSTEWLLSTYRFLKMGISRFRLCDFGWHEKLNAPKPFLRSSKCSLHQGFLATSTFQRWRKIRKGWLFFFFYQMALNLHKHCGLEHVGFTNAEFR